MFTVPTPHFRRNRHAGLVLSAFIVLSALTTTSAFAAVPGAPGIGTAVAGNGQVSVVFSPPSSTGGNPITGYTASCGVRTATGAASPISVIGLVNGVAVSCTVTAQNTDGSSAASTLSNSVTPGLAGVFAYVPKVSMAEAAVINVGSSAVATTIGLVSGQSGVALSPDGARAYLVGQATDDVTVINTQTNSIVTRITVPNRPWSAVVSPDSSRVYITQSSGDAVTVIDTASNTVLAPIAGVSNGYGIAITPDGKRLYVAVAGGSFVNTIDTTTHAVDYVLTGNYPAHVVVSPDGRRAYVTAQVGNNLTVIDDASGTPNPIATLPMGAGTFGVAVSPDSSRVYVTNSNANTVTVVDTLNLAVLATVPVGATPRGVDVTPDGSRVYVVNQGSGSISLLNTASNTVVGAINIGSSSAAYSMGRFMALGGIAPAFTSDPAPGGGFGASYHHALTASGAPAPSFAVASGSLPPGLNLSPAGQIVGTPTSIGSYSGTLRASNGVGIQATQAFAIQIAATVPDAPIIGNAAAGDGSVTLTFAAPANDGGSPILAYTALCSVSATGSGSPITVSGLPNGVAQSCRVRASNAVGDSALSAAANSVTPQAPSSMVVSSSASPVAAGETVIFSATITPATATGTVSFQTGAGSTGCAAAVVAAGMATCSTSYSSVGERVVSAVYGGDAAHIGSSGALAAPQVVIAPTISIATALAGGRKGTAYGPVQLTASGGAAPHQFGIANGALPDGLSLSAAGALAGTPSAHGSFNLRVLATDANQFSGNRDYTITIVSAPDAPLIGKAIRGNAQVEVHFGAPADIGSSPVSGYTASCGAHSATGPASPIVVGNLVNGVAVRCTVIASNAVGDSVASAPSNSVTPATVPDPPSIDSVQRGDAQVSVNFSAPGNNGGETIIGYTASCGSQSQSGKASPITVTGLGNGIAVSCRVIARNTLGDSVPSADSASVTPASVPGAPLIGTATAGNASATVTFQPPAQSAGEPVLDYTLRCLPAMQTAVGAAPPLFVSGLANDVLHTCTVSARNVVGSGPDSATVLVVPSAQTITDLRISKSNSSGFVGGGLPVTYVIAVHNDGPAGVANVRVEDILDAEFSNASWTCSASAGAHCNTAGNGNLDQPIALQPGASVHFELTATAATLPETPLGNIASVSAPAGISDNDLGNNVASDGPDVRGVFRDGFE